MTRTKEVDPNSDEIPDYKSPANRLVHSLRKGYNNLRSKLQTTRERIKYYQIKTRDLEKSRTLYKKEAIDLQEKISKLEKENEKLKEQNSCNVKKKKIQ
jgi:FtsZ-binding cell division protein ZapB